MIVWTKGQLLGSIGSYPNLRDVQPKIQPNPLPEHAALGQEMAAVHPADEGLERRSPMHLGTKIGGED